MTLGRIGPPAAPAGAGSRLPSGWRNRGGALGWTLIVVAIPMVGLPTCKAEPAADGFSSGGPALPDSPMSPPPAPPVGPSTPPPAGEQVPILPGDDIQAIVDAHPEGTLFLIRAGRHVGQSIRPKDGMSFVGEPGAVLDGAGETRYAFDGRDGPDDVSIRGLVIERYAPPPQDGAVMAKDTERCVVEKPGPASFGSIQTTPPASRSTTTCPWISHRFPSGNHSRGRPL